VSARLVLAGLLALLAFAPRSAPAIDYPRLDAPVVDMAGLLSSSERSALAQKLLAFQRATGHQVVVHTRPTLGGMPIEQYSIELAERWKVGRAGANDGVIVIVVPEDREMRIEVGYGLEGTFPDALAGQIIDRVMRPEFRSGNFARGIDRGVDAVLAALRGEPVQAPPTFRDPAPAPYSSRPQPSLGVFGWLIVILVIVAMLSGGGGRRRRRYGGYTSYGGFGGGRSSWGGGGYSGGGGRFGGGGASGKW
jgi:uncharacterized protein